MIFVLNRMIPANQFVSNGYNPFNDNIQARLALPFFKPFIKPSPRNPPVLQPMPSFGELPAVKGYFYGGLIKPSREEVTQQIMKEQQEPTLRDRFNQYDKENPGFFRSLLSLYK